MIEHSQLGRVLRESRAAAVKQRKPDPGLNFKPVAREESKADRLDRNRESRRMLGCRTEGLRYNGKRCVSTYFDSERLLLSTCGRNSEYNERRDLGNVAHHR